MAEKVLLGDLSNGMYVKLGLAVPGQRPEFISLYACASLDDFREALSSFIADCGNPHLKGAAFSTSGWEVDGQIDLVHYGFTLDRHQLVDLLGVQSVAMINNFVAKALAVPALDDLERVIVCGRESRPEQVVAVVGPTTGLGGAFLAPDGRGGWVATHCEGGHADLAPSNALEVEILKLMMDKYGHVSCERAVSSPGLAELWRCLSIIEGEDPYAADVDEIMALASAGDPRALLSIRVQTEMFAAVASDFALTMGARGGVYLCGDHLDKLGDFFDFEVFTRRFYDKGRVSSYLRDVPVYQIVATEPEILGLSTIYG